jgi:hypothetical protein
LAYRTTYPVSGDNSRRLRYEARMINFATSYWYFSNDSSLALGGSRSI